MIHFEMVKIYIQTTKELIYQITVSYLTKFTSLLQFPRDEEGEPIFDELICKSCVPLCSFLSKNPEFVIAPSAVPDESTGPVEDVEPAGIIVHTFFIINCLMFRANPAKDKVQWESGLDAGTSESKAGFENYLLKFRQECHIMKIQ